MAALPPVRLREFNLVYSRPNKVRGNHWHPEFTEYFLVVEGTGVMVWKSASDAPLNIVPMSRASCVRIPSGVIHAFHAMTDTFGMAMITKPWDECEQPLIREEIREK